MARLPLEVAYRQAVMATRHRTERFVLAQFAKGQHRDKDMRLFVARAVPVVLAARRQTSAVTDSYLSQTLTKQLGRPVRPRGPINTDALRGVSAEDVYERPYVEVYSALSRGSAYDAAVQAGTERLKDIVRTDMQMAKTYTSQNVLSHTKGVTGFAREISGDNTCALCAIASTQRYSREDLLPIHPGCSCDVVPIDESNPWDQDTANQRLEDTQKSVLEAFDQNDKSGRTVGLDRAYTAKGAPITDYQRVIVTNNHGEIGPVLGIRGQAFTGPSDLAA